MHHHTNRRRARILLASGLLVLGLGACGSSESGSASDPGAGATDGGGGGAGSSAKVEPCQWYTAEEMSTLLGFTVTMEDTETPQALGRECLYNSDEAFTSVTVRPTDAATYDTLKAGLAAAGGAQVDYPGVGDEAYHNADAEVIAKGNPSVSMSAKKGDVGIQVELATAGDTIESSDKSIEIVAEVATKALG